MTRACEAWLPETPRRSLQHVCVLSGGNSTFDHELDKRAQTDVIKALEKVARDAVGEYWDSTNDGEGWSGPRYTVAESFGPCSPSGPAKADSACSAPTVCTMRERRWPACHIGILTR